MAEGAEHLTFCSALPGGGGHGAYEPTPHNPEVYQGIGYLPSIHSPYIISISSLHDIWVFG